MSRTHEITIVDRFSNRPFLRTVIFYYNFDVGIVILLIGFKSAVYITSFDIAVFVIIKVVTPVISPINVYLFFFALARFGLLDFL